MYSEKMIKLVETHLYSYLWIDKKISEIKEKYLLKNDVDINSWIKSNGKTSNMTELSALKNIQKESEIEIEIKWHCVISNAIKHYEKRAEYEKVKYIKYKYFEKCSTTKIKMEMSISRPTQSRIKTDIIYHIALNAVKENLINVDEIE